MPCPREAGRGPVASAAEVPCDRTDVVAGLGAQAHADLVAPHSQQRDRIDAAEQAHRVGEVLRLLDDGAGLGEVGLLDPRPRGAAVVAHRDALHRPCLERERTYGAVLVDEPGDLGRLDADVDHVGGLAHRVGGGVVVLESAGVGDEPHVAAHRDLRARLDLERAGDEPPHHERRRRSAAVADVHLPVLLRVGVVVDHHEGLRGLRELRRLAETPGVGSVERDEHRGDLEVASGAYSPVPGRKS